MFGGDGVGVWGWWGVWVFGGGGVVKLVFGCGGFFGWWGGCSESGALEVVGWVWWVVGLVWWVVRWVCGCAGI